jgi:hypothetical protein
MATEDSLGEPEKAVLLTLMAEAREVSNPELEDLIGTNLTGHSRNKLNDAGLVSSRKEGRAYVHELTDKGWRWCSRELASAYRPKKTTLGRALYLALGGLHRYLQRSDLKVADVFGRGGGAASVVAESPTPVHDLEERIQTVYRKLAKEPRDWVSLTQLRPLLSDANREAVDEALLQMSRSGRANLVPQANQKALSQADRNAAVRIGHEDCHLVSIEDS